jgi:hypothetical protein
MRLAAVLHYTSTSVFTKGSYAGIKAVEFEVIGGGGGSGYAAATSGSQIAFGRGGAGGAYAHGFVLAGSLATSETVTVGAGGTGGTSGTPDATNGGSSSFGAHGIAGGGEGGNDTLTTTAATGTSFLRNFGGAASGSATDIGIPGEGLGSVDFSAGVYSCITGLEGARSGGPYGATAYNTIGAAPGGVGNQASLAGLGIGSGARGPSNATSQSGKNGAAGATGRVIVRVYV